ncbi:MAG: hypothetical protein J7K81_07950 [Methanophagales archaeon]|nr:hypothetical protein [Methanophagales archaeon]
MAFSVELYKEVEKLEPALRSVMRGIMGELERHREEQAAIARAEFIHFSFH